MEKKYIYLIIGVVIILAIAGMIVKTGITGNVVENQQDGESDAVISNSESDENACTDGCNPNDINQYCSSSEWVDCQSGKVCSLGSCVVPTTIARTFDGSGGGGSGGGGSGGGGSGGGVDTGIESSSGSQYAVGNTNELGTIDSEKMIEVSKEDRTYFTSGLGDYSFILLDITKTDIVLSISGLQPMLFKIGDSKPIDLNGDGNSDITIWLKSINIISNKAKLIIR